MTLRGRLARVLPAARSDWNRDSLCPAGNPDGATGRIADRDIEASDLAAAAYCGVESVPALN